MAAALSSRPFLAGSCTVVRQPRASAPSVASTSGRARVVAVQAALKLPAGVTVPPKQPESKPPAFGFVNWAEKINGRAAMLGFFGVLLVEAVANKGVLELAGLQVGKGLGFEL